MTTILYDFIFLIFAILYIPYLTFRGKWHRGLLARMGFLPRDVTLTLLRTKNIWVHAVSVGEVLAVLNFIDKIRQAFPLHRIVLTTVTPTGFGLARSKLPPEDVVMFAPLDFSPVVGKFIRHISPEIYISAETEIWPNIFHALTQNGIPIVLVNGRISSHAYPWYRRFRFVLRHVFKGVKAFCMQTQTDAVRVIALGALEQRVHVTGNMKFDDIPSATGPAIAINKIFAQNTVWVAGSTHPGEEEIVLGIYSELAKEFPNLRLVIAPRHIERAKEVGKLAGSHKLVPLYLSGLLEHEPGTKGLPEPNILIVDTIGHLKCIYQKADFVFVGKSLTGKGGQNIIEPAFYSKPIMTGPHTQNFRSVVDLFKQANALVEVKNPAELKEHVRKLLQEPGYADSLGRAALDVVAKNRGATQRTVDIILKILQ